MYTYDARNLLLSKSVTQTGDNINYSYNEAGSRIGMTDVTGSYTYLYYENDWLYSISKNGVTQVSYTYDTVGNIETVTDKKGIATTYSYDSSNRMKTVSYTIAGAAKTTTYSYDKNGNREYILYHGGVKEEYAYDKNNRLLNLTNKRPDGSQISGYSYTYYDNGLQKTKVDSYGTTNYNYDKMGRITDVVAQGKTTINTYDKSGNRQSLSETYTSDQPSGYVDERTGIEIKYRIKSSDYIYSDANKLQRLIEHMKNASGVEILQKTTNYQYDNNGNELIQTIEYQRPFATGMQESVGLTGFGEGNTGTINKLVESVSNEFDGFNRLKKTDRIKAGTRIITEFIYNGDDLRTSKTVKKSTNNYTPEITNYLYDRQHVILETDANDNLSVRYIRGINYIARVDAGNKLSYFLYNGHGDVVQTVSEAGVVENRYDYDIFGNPTLIIEGVQGGGYICAIRYAGEFYDSETGLYYLRARYYNPYIGRFISEDSYWGEDTNPLSLNLYTYALNNPIMFIDPSGHVNVHQDSGAGSDRREEEIVDESEDDEDDDEDEEYSIPGESEDTDDELIEALRNWIEATGEGRTENPTDQGRESENEDVDKEETINNKDILNKIDKTLSIIAENMSDIVKALNNQVDPNVNWLDGGTYKIGTQNPVDGIIDGYIEVKVGDTPIKSKLEAKLFSNENVKSKCFYKWKILIIIWHFEYFSRCCC